MSLLYLLPKKKHQLKLNYKMRKNLHQQTSSKRNNLKDLNKKRTVFSQMQLHQLRSTPSRISRSLGTVEQHSYSRSMEIYLRIPSQKKLTRRRVRKKGRSSA